MSYDIYLRNVVSSETVEVDRHAEGGTHALGGTTEAHLNVTYNYASDFRYALDRREGFRWLYGKSGKETISRLEEAVELLGTERDEDYWKPTPGNAGHALSILLRWAKQHPFAVWEGD